MSEWRLARSLEKLLEQVNAAYPNRSKSDDGTIGDAAHAARKSDHNPNINGVVQALDLTHDPAHFDSYKFAELLRVHADHRIKYIISNHRIANPSIQSFAWRPYTGADPHTGHLHLSVADNPAFYDNDSPWEIDAVITPDDKHGAKGSWYSQHTGKYHWIDEGDAPGSNALGVPDDQQGIALPSRATLGEWFDVTAPNGVTLKLRQTDIGPSARTGRGIDIAAVAAEKFGYSPENFPTNGTFYWTPATEAKPVPTPSPQPIPQLPPPPSINLTQDELAQLINYAQSKSQPMWTAIITALLGVFPQAAVWLGLAQTVLTTLGALGPIVDTVHQPATSSGQISAATLIAMFVSGVISKFSGAKTSGK